MKLTLIKLAASAAMLAVAVPAAAQETRMVEVAANPVTNRLVTINAFDPIGQSFTAFTDTISSVGFQFGSLNPNQANNPITLSILAGETLVGPALYSTTFYLPLSINSRTPTWFDIALPDFAVTNGAVYSLVLATGSSARNAVAVGPGFNVSNGQFLSGDAYTGGRAFANNALYSNCPNTAASVCDLNFRMTGTLLTAAVPEPSTWALLILGFGVIGAGVRRRRAIAFA